MDTVKYGRLTVDTIGSKWMREFCGATCLCVDNPNDPCCGNPTTTNPTNPTTTTANPTTTTANPTNPTTTTEKPTTTTANTTNPTTTTENPTNPTTTTENPTTNPTTCKALSLSPSNAVGSVIEISECYSIECKMDDCGVPNWEPITTGDCGSCGADSAHLDLGPI